MKKFLFLVIFSPVLTLGQNLVPNGSFEDTASCPTALGQLWKAIFWVNPTLGTPDLMHSCSGWPGISAIGYQQPHFGSAFAGFLPGQPASNVREYIETPLLDTLIGGECYQLSFYANLGHLRYSTDAIHAYFSDTLINNVPSLSVLNFIPQIKNQTGNYLDTLNWTLIQGDFEAIGGEKFLIIGNFDSSAYCNWLIVDSNATNNSCYIYIDDIALVPSICTGFADNYDYLFEIYPNPTIDILNINCNSDKLFEVKIFDSLSKLRLIATFNRETKVVLSNLSTGFYYYQIFYKNRLAKTGKVLKLQ